ERTPLLDGQRARFGARLDAAGDGEDARELYAAAVHRFADAGFVFLEGATVARPRRERPGRAGSRLALRGFPDDAAGAAAHDRRGEHRRCRMSTLEKQADLAGPGIGDYDELARVLPDHYRPLLDPRETMRALYAAKRLIEDRLCEELNLTMVQVPLIVDRESGVNDYLDRDGSRTPVTFHIRNDGV